MLYMPGIFGEDLMDRWFDDMDREFARMEKPLYGHNARNLMKTDVREHDDSYEVDIEPGNNTPDTVTDHDDSQHKGDHCGCLHGREEAVHACDDHQSTKDYRYNFSCHHDSHLPS